MNMDEVYSLMDRFESSTLGELEIEMSGTKLVLKKNIGCVSNVEVATSTPSVVQNNIPQVDTAVNKTEEVQDYQLIKAPLVGTFYTAPSPDSEPFIKVGQEIKEGDVIGIIEAMKLMNEITSTVSGTIVSIEVNNEDVVEFDQVLVKVK